MKVAKQRKPVAMPEDVAGNGLLNRRALLGQGIAVAGAVLAAGKADRKSTRLNSSHSH